MHCIYFKVKKEEERPWNCKTSVCTPTKYCPHRVDTKKLKELITHALNPEVQRQTLMKRSREGGCVRPVDPLRGMAHHVTSSSQPDG